ncbi:MAG: hypothetical protein EBQ99_08930 [Planctomycetes bacterium]|nr:hypothetical protein [Planctomycetota bacterium]
MRHPTLHAAALAALLPATSALAQSQKLHLTWLWHMEQPIYWPDANGGRYERAWQSILRKDGGATNPQNDLRGIFGLDDRVAAYQWRPRDCVNAIRWSPEAGAQVSFSGGLIENIQSFAEAGGQLGYSTNWHAGWRESRGWSTATAGTNVPRMDIVQFSFHHALLPLCEESTIRKELALYQLIHPEAFAASPTISKGFFPSEMAFSERIIPLLAEAGIQWTFVSGEKISRACPDFPVQLGSGGVNCDPPNKADQVNPAGVDWFRLSISRGCGPAEAMPLAFTPHRAKWVNPDTGVESSVIVVPCSQSLGWLDGYNPLPLNHLDTLQARNPGSRPQLLVLAHDGDNAWGGGYSYYMEAVPNIVSSASGSGYVPTMVQKYLADHPVPATDVVHVEDGAWVNADGDFGAPQFLNWNWPPMNASGEVDVDNGWAEDIRNWAVITATQNLVDTAEQIQTDAGQPVRMSHVLRPQSGSRASERAWHFFLGSLNSGYMYYGTALDMEVKPTIACNEANAQALPVIGNGSQDRTAPTIWLPQRWPWNPGGLNYGPAHKYQSRTLSGDFAVWTFVHDASGLSNVTLKYRVDVDGANPLSSNQNETYAGGSEVGAWVSVPMTVSDFPAGNVLNDGSIDFFEMPGAIAKRCVGRITGLRSKLVDYHVEATDARGNVKRSAIQHVWVGESDGTGGGGGGGGGGTVVAVSPSPVQAGASVTVTYDAAGRALASATSVKAHVGFNAWGSVISPDVAMTRGTDGKWSCSVSVPASATQLDLVFNNGSGTWDNNGGQDWHFPVQGGTQPTWQMDGTLDAGATSVATRSGRNVWAGLQGDVLYVATQDAGEGSDVFLLLADQAGALTASPWSKGGQTMTWRAFLADENDNGFCGWFDAAQSQTFAATKAAFTGANGGVVEGTINLRELLGTMPDEVLLAAAPFGNANAGALVAAQQCPAGDGDGLLEAAEFVTVRLCDLTASCCPGDLDGSGETDAGDIGSLLLAFGQAGGPADLDGSGVVDAGDIGSLLLAFGPCPTAMTLPDPGHEADTDLRDARWLRMLSAP